MQEVANSFGAFLEKNRKLSKNTLLSYGRDINFYINYLEEKNITDFGATNRATVLSYVLYLKNSGRATSTILRTIVSLKAFYGYMLSKGLIKTDPTVGIEAPKPEKKVPQILSLEEINSLLEQPSGTGAKERRDKTQLGRSHRTHKQ